MKTNSESLDAESVTVPTTKHESDDLNMSAGAEMLIERMKTNPDDFKYGGKFYKVRNVLEHTDPAAGWISPRDFEALLEAYGRLILEPQFSEWVYNEIFSPKEEEPNPYAFSNAMAQGQQAQMRNAMLQGTSIYPSGSALQNAYQPVMTLGSSGNLGVGTSASNATRNTMTVAANSGNPTITLGNTTLSESMLGQIKNKLGL